MEEREGFGVYVAGRTADTAWVRQVQEIVREHGGYITFDWTGPDGEIRADWSDQPERAAQLSRRERQAVMSADLTILCWSPGALGALLETGIALAHGKDVIVLGEPRESVFWYLPGVKRAADETALRAILRIRQAALLQPVG